MENPASPGAVLYKTVEYVLAFSGGVEKRCIYAFVPGDAQAFC